MADRRRQFGHHRTRCGKHVELLQCRHSQFQCIRAEAVMAAIGFLPDHAHRLEADQVVMHIRHGHAGTLGNLA
ncbi:hypothetical protein D3C81_2091610 [compost metagenome]